MNIKKIVFGLFGMLLTALLLYSVSLGFDFKWLRVLGLIGILYVIGLLRYLNNAKITVVFVFLWLGLIYQLSDHLLRDLIIKKFDLGEWSQISLWLKIQIWLYYGHTPLIPILLFLSIIKSDTPEGLPPTSPNEK